MNIGEYTFQEFKDKAASFHGYPAPGLLIGGYMVEMAKAGLPEGTLFEAMVETRKCLPDAVQLLSLCSVGNNWMKIINLGRYALSLYDKYTGEGFRVHLDTAKMAAWPEIDAWYLKKKPKREQDTEKLFAEIEDAGDRLATIQPIRIAPRYLRHASMGHIGVCPSCQEAYPTSDGGICRGCQGESPFIPLDCEPGQPQLRAIRVEDAVGKKTLHDMTRIDPGKSKGAEFTAGQELTAGDVCRLQTMGRDMVYVEDAAPTDGSVHENDAAASFAQAMAGRNITYEEPHEGKITFRSAVNGLFSLDRNKLNRFNLVPDVMCATRHDNTVALEGKAVAGCRAIPLYISPKTREAALDVLGGEPLFAVHPFRPRPVGILVTGTEVFQGIIEDRFAPIIESKVTPFGCTIAGVEIAPDDADAIANAAGNLLAAGAELLVTTAGLSVDPGDVTRQGLVQAGLKDFLYGAPLLPGTMSLVGTMDRAVVMGVPACALFYKTTAFDLLLPRILADQEITRADLARMGEGGLCLSCRSCTFPKCPFGK